METAVYDSAKVLEAIVGNVRTAPGSINWGRLPSTLPLIQWCCTVSQLADLKPWLSARRAVPLAPEYSLLARDGIVGKQKGIVGKQ